jgi:prephenate dehydrogenase
LSRVSDPVLFNLQPSIFNLQPLLFVIAKPFSTGLSFLMHWNQISLIGVGLLGGSLGLAARQRRLADRVVGFVRRPASVSECERAGAVDKAELDLFKAVDGADLVVLCTPIAQMRDLLSRMAPALKPGTLITDVGSVKANLVEHLEPLARSLGACFIGSHPMAGTEKMGVGAAKADLFHNAACIVTPTPNSPPKLVSQLEEFWKDVGAVPIPLTAELHDVLVSRSSHLPHVVAATLVNYVLSPTHPKEQALLCANGFRDTTRIASGSPEMWRDICIANHKNISRVLGVFIEDLRDFQEALEKGEIKVIEEFFNKAKRRRDAWRSLSSSPSPE